MTGDLGPRWLDQAACRGAPVVLWYPPKGGNTEAGRAICARCPVRTECVTDAVSRRETRGMWGGASGRTLRELREAFIHRGHPEPELVDGCSCQWCEAARAHFATLDRWAAKEIARFERQPRTDFAALTHGLASTYNAGCRCDPCRVAKAATAAARRRTA